MFIPRYWARAHAGNLSAVGWSDVHVQDAERLARERLAKAQARAEDAPWDYYPDRPVKEEILDSPEIPGIRVVVTRNRLGAEVLNTDLVAFIDIDLKPKAGGCLGAFLSAPKFPAPEAVALNRAGQWAISNGARLRAYRTAGGLRLIRMDRLMDPKSDETTRMFEAMGTDPQYQRLCRVQESYRARLTPKPYRIGLGAAPGAYPRTDPAAQQAFAAWLARYRQLSSTAGVCENVADIGGAAAVEAASRLAEWHDERTVRPGAPLA